MLVVEAEVAGRRRQYAMKIASRAVATRPEDWEQRVPIP